MNWSIYIDGSISEEKNFMYLLDYYYLKSIDRSIYLFGSFWICLSFYLFIFLSFHLFIFSSFHLPIHLPLLSVV